MSDNLILQLHSTLKYVSDSILRLEIDNTATENGSCLSRSAEFDSLIQVCRADHLAISHCIDADLLNSGQDSSLIIALQKIDIIKFCLNQQSNSSLDIH